MSNDKTELLTCPFCGCTMDYRVNSANEFACGEHAEPIRRHACAAIPPYRFCVSSRVVMPERMQDLSAILGENWDSLMKAQYVGWNACLDEFERLNK